MTEENLTMVKRFQIALPILRTSLGLTQLDLAKYLDVPKLTIQTIESFKSPPKLIYFWAISGILGALANMTKNDDAAWMYTILVNLPDDKLRNSALDICNEVMSKLDEIGIAKAQTELRETFKKWVQDHSEDLQKYYEDKT